MWGLTTTWYWIANYKGGSFLVTCSSLSAVVPHDISLFCISMYVGVVLIFILFRQPFYWDSLGIASWAFLGDTSHSRLFVPLALTLPSLSSILPNLRCRSCVTHASLLCTIRWLVLSIVISCGFLRNFFDEGWDKHLEAGRNYATLTNGSCGFSPTRSVTSLALCSQPGFHYQAWFPFCGS